MQVVEKSFENIRYLVCYPAQKSKTTAVLMHLNGAGSRGTDLQLCRNCVPYQYAQANEDFPFVLVIPLCEEDTWFDEYERLINLLEYVKQEEKADKYLLSGVSMGAYTGWQVLASKPDLFDKAILLCGGGMYWNAGRIKTPVWAFHGKEDKSVFVEETEKMTTAVNAIGGSVKATYFDGVAHNCWDIVYNDKAVYDWLVQE